jgi:L-2,4-diaminobutyrate decarboxylase
MKDYAAAAHCAVDILAAHVDAAARGEGLPTAVPAPDEVAEALEVRRWIRDGGMDAEALASWLARYLDATVRLHHPAEMVHQVAVPDTGAAIADLVHGATNNPMSKYDMGAAAATLEHEVVDWMRGLVGFSDGAGVLTHGGSIANLTVMLAARARVAPEGWRRGTPRDLALLAPTSAHYSVRRAAAIIGLGEDAVVELDVDDLERVRVDRLADALDRCRAAGRTPLALVATAPATSTGLHDDIEAIADFCRANGIWLHVDAAHGDSALLSPRDRGRLAGIERADSVIWDAHKLLRVSGLCAAVLVRRAEELPAALRQKGDYLFDDGEEHGYDTLDRQLETTKAPLGTKLFLALAWAGERGLGEYVAGRYEMARRFHAILSRDPEVTCPYEPESNILCFRFGDCDPVELRDRLLHDGQLHIGTTTIGGERHLRLVITSPHTDESTAYQLLAALRRHAQVAV